MTFAFACALESAVSTSIIRETYCSSEKICLASSVPNKLRKILESMAVAFMAVSLCSIGRCRRMRDDWYAEVDLTMVVPLICIATVLED